MYLQYSFFIMFFKKSKSVGSVKLNWSDIMKFIIWFCFFTFYTWVQNAQIFCEPDFQTFSIASWRENRIEMDVVVVVVMLTWILDFHW